MGIVGNQPNTTKTSNWRKETMAIVHIEGGWVLHLYRLGYSNYWIIHTHPEIFFVFLAINNLDIASSENLFRELA